jgi:two-component system phosphate regulon sensor histidine kinase PhoR
MRDQIGFLEQMRSEMIHYAAHDLRNPLSILYGYLSLMQLDQEQLPERFAHYLELMEQAAQKMQRIIDDIQLMEDIEASADQMPTDSVDLAALLPIVMRDFEHQAHTKQIVVTLSSEADSLHVTGDLGQLQRAMGNLISNAITYTPQGGNVCIRLEGDADTVRFSIRDDGFGIAQDVQAAVWRPFYRVRTRQTMDIDGSGLGLFMVKRIIERHNGSLHMESEVGQGSVIGFSLPRLSA